MVEVAGKDDIVCLYVLPVAEGNGDGFVVNDVHASASHPVCGYRPMIGSG